MRILWLTPNSSVTYSSFTYNHYFGAGWIDSLELSLVKQPGITLGMCFFHPTDSEKKVNGNTVYYPVRYERPGGFQRLSNNWRSKTTSAHYWNDIMKAVEDFKPDVIHVFGTESYFGGVLTRTTIPVIIHLQGILGPVINAYYPPGINGWSFAFFPFYFKKHILGNSLVFDKRSLGKLVIRESGHFRHASFFMGRTDWDKGMVQLLAPQAKYFHVDEILRAPFYDAATWRPKGKGKIVLISTISDTIYKGLDVVLKTAILLKQHSGLDFEWRIIGIKPKGVFEKLFSKIFRKKFEDFNIIFCGVMGPEDLIKQLNEAHIYIHPSYIDNSPNSVCEAQMVGLPVIACNVGGVSSLIKSGVSGILVPANGPYEMALQIKQLANDQPTAEKMSIRGMETAKERHNREKILTDLMAVYETVSLEKKQVNNLVNA